MKKEQISIRKLVGEYYGDMSETSNEENYTLEDPRYYKANRDSFYAAVIQNGHFADMFLVEDAAGVKLCTHPVRGYLAGNEFINLYVPGYDSVDELNQDNPAVDLFDMTIVKAVLEAYFTRYFQYLKENRASDVDMVEFEKQHSMLPKHFFAIKNSYMSSKQLAYKTLEETIKELNRREPGKPAMIADHNLEPLQIITHEQLGKLIEYNMHGEPEEHEDAENHGESSSDQPNA